jgi:hypothetical protein
MQLDVQQTAELTSWIHPFKAQIVPHCLQESNRVFVVALLQKGNLFHDYHRKSIIYLFDR